MSIKKILSLMLIISIIMTSFVATVFAAEEEQSPDAPYERAVTVLSALGIMEGKSETDFGENDFLTRAEMSTIAVRVIGLDSEGTAGAESGFSDVDSSHWGKYYIDTATALDIVNGNGDGTFSPDEETTAEHAVKMLVCALGYELMAEDKGGYPAGYRAVAAQLDLFHGVDFPEGFDKPIERWKIAMLVYNALEVDLMEVKVYGDDQYSAVTQDKTVLGAYHDVERRTGTVTATYESTMEKENLEPGEIIIDGIRYTTKLNLSKYVGYRVDFYCRIVDGSSIPEIIAAFPAEDEADRTEVDFDDINSVTVSANLDVAVEYYTEDGKSKSLSALKPVIMYNGKAEEFADAAAAQAFLDANMKQGQLVLLKNSEYKDVLQIENYDAYVVSRVDPENMQVIYNVYEVGRTTAQTLDLSDESDPDRKAFVYGENGEEITLGDLAANDVIMVYASADKKIYKIYQSKRQVTGIINRRDQTSSETSSEPGDGEDQQEQPYWETISEVTFDNFVMDANVKDGNNKRTTWSGQMTVQDTTPGGKIRDRIIYLQEGVYYYYDQSRYPGKVYVTHSPYAWGKWTDIVDPPTPVNEGDTPEVMGEKAFQLDRQYHFTGGNKKASPDSTVILYNIFNESDVAVGDKVRITAWVYAPSDRLLETAGSPPRETDDYTVSMWLSENEYTDRGLTSYVNENGGKVHNQFEMATDDEVVTKIVPADQWNKVVMEYDINGSNRNISSIKINNDNKTHTVPVYPYRMSVSGIKVEKYVDPNATTGRPVLTVDPTDYDIYIDGQRYQPVSSFPTSLLEMGSSVTLLLDSNNKIVGFTRSLTKNGYGMVMDVGVAGGAFGETLMVKILDADNTLNTYETLKEVQAFNGTDVVKMPAASLVTNKPEDPMTGWHLWSTNNVENFEAIPRTWMTDSDKSKAASRKLVYYETNAEGEIHTILVPSMPEDHPEAKIVMVKDFEYILGNTTASTLFHSYWPGFLTHTYTAGRVEPVYRLPSDAMKFWVWADDYSEDDYRVHTGGLWEDNVINGRTWNQAQLYRLPGSKTIDFLVMNPSKVNAEPEHATVLIVDNIEETVDGYVLNGHQTRDRGLSNHDYSYKIKENLRLFENLWMTEPNADGVQLTWENIANYVGTTPYCVSYEALGQETPYVESDTLEAGDVVRVIVENNEITYLEVIRRVSTGLVAPYSVVNNGNLDGYFDKSNGYTNGEIVEINKAQGTVKIRGYYWGCSSDIVSAVEYSQADNSNKNNRITELTVDFPPYANVRIWDEEKKEYLQASFFDFEIGDKILIVGSMEQPQNSVILFKNHGK